MYSIFKAYYISHNFLQSVFLDFITELLTSSLREQSEKKKFQRSTLFYSS